MKRRRSPADSTTATGWMSLERRAKTGAREVKLGPVDDQMRLCLASGAPAKDPRHVQAAVPSSTFAPGAVGKAGGVAPLVPAPVHSYQRPLTTGGTTRAPSW